jgi:ElaB/YqjD/DUF883 family membrane-anchored ribosome-binding protein
MTMASKTKANGHLRNKLKKIYTRNNQRLANASAALSTAATDAKDRVLDAEQTIKKYTKTNPWKAIGMSVLAGVIVAQIFGHRK